MATLNIEGRRIKVDDSFLSLSPEQQNATVDEIAKSFAPQQPDSQAVQDASAQLSDFTQNPARGQYEALPGWKKPIVAASDIVNRTADGLMFGAGDEIAAGMRAPFTDKTYAEELADQEQRSAAERARAGGAATVAEMAGGLKTALKAPSFAGNAINTGQGLARTAVGSLIDGGIVGGLTGALGTGSVDERLDALKSGAELGAGLGLATPFAVAGGSKLLQKVVSPFQGSTERSALADALNREGIDVSAGQRTGNDALRNLESEVGGAKTANMMDRQGEQFTKAALKRAGIDADRALPETLSSGYEKLGKRFDDLASLTTTKLDSQLQDDLLNDVISYQQNATAVAPVVENTVNRISEIAKANKGIIPGKEYQSLRSDIGKASKRTSDVSTAAALRDIQESLDDAVQRSSSGKTLDAWKDVRNKYRNYLVVERAATGAGENAAAGLISPSQLRNATVNLHGRRNYATGNGDFAELARSGEAVLKPLPNSGTAGRTAARNLYALGPSVVGSGAGAAYGAQDGGGLQGALVGALTGFVAPKVVGQMLMSKKGQQYLANQLLRSGMTPGKRALLNQVLTYSGASTAGRLASP